jgi:hypothetical protein
MSIDINKNHFPGIEEEMPENKTADLVKTPMDSVGYIMQYVTCYTCHQGKERPINIPPAKEEKKL